MCGIAGALHLSLGQIPDINIQLNVMNQLQRHRRPDGEGIWIHPRQQVGFAHRRLSIIDLTTGNQPMHNGIGSIRIVFNSDIYNFQELRAMLLHLRNAGAASARRQTRETLDISQQAQLILSIGRLTDQKGHIYLVNVQPRILSYFPKAMVLLAGDGSARQELEKWVRALERGEAVRFLGTCADAPTLMVTADLFVLPSISEGVPNAQLKAMGMGLPVLASRLACVEEIVTHGQTCYLTSPGEAVALGEAIISLLENFGLCQRLGKAGRELVEKRCAQERMC